MTEDKKITTTVKLSESMHNKIERIVDEENKWSEKSYEFEDTTLPEDQKTTKSDFIRDAINEKFFNDTPLEDRIRRYNELKPKYDYKMYGESLKEDCEKGPLKHALERLWASFYPVFRFETLSADNFLEQFGLFIDETELINKLDGDKNHQEEGRTHTLQGEIFTHKEAAMRGMEIEVDNSIDNGKLFCRFSGARWDVTSWINPVDK